MTIRRARPAETGLLLEIWERSVRATHTFLPEEDVLFFRPLVRDALAGDALDLWVLSRDDDTPVGFMGLAGPRIEALFLDPEHRRRGGGRRLVEHAIRLHGELTLDVNEQNPDARRFYEACGFVVEGRSPLDGAGKPYPLLHMRRPAGTPAAGAPESR
jgi:putative acetyltransferase